MSNLLYVGIPLGGVFVLGILISLIEKIPRRNHSSIESFSARMSAISTLNRSSTFEDEGKQAV
ncbi:MAG: hypothetical protein M0019_05120 [Actinomycetota bacterium]|nr:hypothetical protein [Actinomycetota bacterium]